VLVFSLVAKYDKSAKIIFCISIVIMNYINFIIIVLSPPARTRYKSIGPLNIKVNYFESVRFSLLAMTALIAIILIFYFKNNGFKIILIKVSTVLSGLYIIFTAGKVSVLLGLFITAIVAKFLFFEGELSKITKVVSTLILLFTFFLGWILPSIISLTEKWQINYSYLTSRRNIIWIQYLEYFSNLPLHKRLLGSFFIRTYNDVIQQGFLHPHNQWITILVSTGFIGLLLYFILFKRAYNYTIESGDSVGFMFLLALNIYATADDYILLTAGCVNAFLVFYFASQNKHKNSYERTIKIYKDDEISNLTIDN
jgi:O-antigen ligase